MKKMLSVFLILFTIVSVNIGATGRQDKDSDSSGEAKTQIAQNISGVTYYTTVADFEKATGKKMTFNESPLLKDLVKKGLLPPLEERLPEEPEVVVPVETIGKYGGTWNEVSTSPRFADIFQITTEDSWLQYNRDYSEIRPNLVKKVDFDDDGRIIIIHYRKGVRWSDGALFTTEDIKFAWEDLILNSEYTQSAQKRSFSAGRPSWGFESDGSPMKVEVIDDYTLRLIYKDPHYASQYRFIWWLDSISLVRPKHYLSQFHPKYNSNIDDYTQLADKDRVFENPDFPVLWPWKVKEIVAGNYAILERNPYFWKVDTEGNQLPYIDEIVVTIISDSEVRLLKTINGEVDATFRGVSDFSNYAVLHENKIKGEYRVLNWGDPGGNPIVTINQTLNIEESGDIWMKELLRDKWFRRAVSLGLDRERINDVVFNGMGIVGQAAFAESCLAFQGKEGKDLYNEWVNNYADHDPDKANSYLDDLGLTKRDSDGYRLRPDGTELEFIAEMAFSGGGAKMDNEWPQLFKEGLNSIGLKVKIINSIGTDLGRERIRQGIPHFGINDVIDMPSINPLTFSDYLYPVAGVGDARNWVLIRKWFRSSGKEGEAPAVGSPEEKLMSLYYEALAQPSLDEAIPFIRDAIRVHIDDGPFITGLTGNPPRLVVVKENFRNVPDNGIINGWAPNGPANVDPSQFFFND